MDASTKRMFARLIYIGSMLINMGIYVAQDDLTLTLVFHFTRAVLSVIDKWLAYHNWTYAWYRPVFIKEASLLNVLSPLTSLFIFIQWKCEGVDNNQICRLVQLISATCSLGEATLDEIIYISLNYY